MRATTRWFQAFSCGYCARAKGAKDPPVDYDRLHVLFRINAVESIQVYGMMRGGSVTTLSVAVLDLP